MATISGRGAARNQGRISRPGRGEVPSTPAEGRVNGGEREGGGGEGGGPAPGDVAISLFYCRRPERYDLRGL